MALKIKERTKKFVSHRREKRHGGNKEEWFGTSKNMPLHGWPFYDWTPDTFYTRRLFDLLIVPQNHSLVKLNLGRAGEWIIEGRNGRIYRDDRSHEDKLLGAPLAHSNESKRYRDWPFGGAFGPGFYCPLTFFGLSEIAVVYTGQRERNLKDRSVLTKDPIQMDEVDGLLTFHVRDPFLAMTGTERGEDFEGLTHRIARARLTDVLNNSTLDEILQARDEQTNFAYLYDEKGNLKKDSNGSPERYEPVELKRIGVRLDGLRVTEYKLPDDVEKLFRKRVAAKLTADAAESHKKAGAVYNANDPSKGAREVLYVKSATRKDSNVKYDVHTGKMADALEEVAKNVGGAISDLANAFVVYLRNKKGD